MALTRIPAREMDDHKLRGHGRFGGKAGMRKGPGSWRRCSGCGRSPYDHILEGLGCQEVKVQVENKLDAFRVEVEKVLTPSTLFRRCPELERVFDVVPSGDCPRAVNQISQVPIVPRNLFGFFDFRLKHIATDGNASPPAALISSTTAETPPAAGRERRHGAVPPSLWQSGLPPPPVMTATRFFNSRDHGFASCTVLSG